MKTTAETQNKTILTLGTSALALLSLFVSGCYPVLLQESKRADARPEYVTKYFSVKPPKGRWAAVVDRGRSFKVPHEGDLLAEDIPEIVDFFAIPWFMALGLKYGPTLTIASYPIINPERFYGDPMRMAKAVEAHFKQSKESWRGYRRISKWTGDVVEVETKPYFGTVEIGGKTFFESSEIYADTGARAYQKHLKYYYFAGKRAFVFDSVAESDKDGQILKIMESFRPIDYPSDKGELLEKALYLWGLGQGKELSLSRTDFIADYSFEEVTQAFQDVIDLHPGNYLAHLFLGIHYLTPRKGSIYDGPTVFPGDDVQRVTTKDYDTFDLYNLNPIWVINKKDIYSYLLRGNFKAAASITEFKKALEIKPESYAARYFLSWLYLRTQEYEKAISEMRKLLEKHPQETDALLLLSVAYRILGSEKEADEYYRTFRKEARIGTSFYVLDNILGPGLADALGRALGEAISHGISH